MASLSERKVALVTGAAQGIGQAIVLKLAEDGFDVAVNDIKGKEDKIASVIHEVEKKGRRAICVAADVSIEEEVKGMVDTAVKELGRLDVVSSLLAT
jgi:NAD(P)-dependent dehydrogenase (short-subunit alcohol dehydrogenase family)